MEDKLLATTCPVGGNHRLVEKSFMCQHCEAMSDEATAFSQAPCPRRLDLNANPPPESKVLTKAEAALPAAPLEPPTKQALFPDPPEVLKKAEIEMARLLMLKGLQTERLELPRLLAIKQQRKTGTSGSLVAFVVFIYMHDLSQNLQDLPSRHTC